MAGKKPEYSGRKPAAVFRKKYHARACKQRNLMGSHGGTGEFSARRDLAGTILCLIPVYNTRRKRLNSEHISAKMTEYRVKEALPLRQGGSKSGKTRNEVIP